MFSEDDRRMRKMLLSGNFFEVLGMETEWREGTKMRVIFGSGFGMSNLVLVYVIVFFVKYLKRLSVGCDWGRERRWRWRWRWSGMRRRGVAACSGSAAAAGCAEILG